MRISDWSSDVCSSDLRSCRPRRRPGRHATGESAGARAAGRSRGLRVRLLPLPGDQLFQPDLATVLMLDLGLPVVALAVVEPVLRRAHVRRQVLDVIGAAADALVLHDLPGIARVAHRSLVQRPPHPPPGRLPANSQPLTYNSK